MSRPWNDDELLARLAEARQAADRVPREFIEAGKAAYAWRDIDAELAELVYDSALEEAQLAGQMRAEQAQLRALTFTAAALTIEIEVSDEALLGQLVPPEAGEVEVITPAGTAQLEPIDDVGFFTIRPVPAGSFRIHCRTASGTFVATNWLSL
jgi:multidrug efflux pump subunit AcrA (membrane-fusion protein)